MPLSKRAPAAPGPQKNSRVSWKPVRLLPLRTQSSFTNAPGSRPATLAHTNSQPSTRTLSLRHDGTFDITASSTPSQTHTRAISGSSLPRLSHASSASSRSSSLNSPLTPADGPDSDSRSSVYSDDLGGADDASDYGDDSPPTFEPAPMPEPEPTLHLDSLQPPRALVVLPFECGATHDQFMDALEATDASVSRPACPRRSVGHTIKAHQQQAARRSVYDDGSDRSAPAPLAKVSADEYVELIQSDPYAGRGDGIAVVSGAGNVVGWL